MDVTGLRFLLQRQAEDERLRREEMEDNAPTRPAKPSPIPVPAYLTPLSTSLSVFDSQPWNTLGTVGFDSSRAFEF